MKRILAGLVLGVPVLAANPNLTLDRFFSLGNPEPFLTEAESRRMILEPGAALSFTLPRACFSPLDSSSVCRETHGFRMHPANSGDSLGLSLLGGTEFRQNDDFAAVTEAGIRASGSKGPVSFHLDTRMFAAQSGDPAFSWDREDVDHQAAEVTGSISYASFARYRGNLDLDLPFGRFTVARDAAHWGPGIYQNLTFHQDAVPFHQLVFTTWLGPLSVTSLYGDLSVDDRQLAERNLKDRNLYAHRYELRAGGNVLLGVSEVLILFEENKPYLFTPIFPLFIAKGFMYETANNGNLSADVTLRLPGRTLLYTEFLLDDLESPSSLLLKNYSQNKWAWMAGGHAAWGWAAAAIGFVFEYSLIKPWVYSHFTPYTVQAANMGYPLGNQDGPNSQAALGRLYAKLPSGLHVSGQLKLLWKGREEGSALNDPAPIDPKTAKSFLGGAGAPEAFAILSFSHNWKHLDYGAGAELGTSPGWTAHVRYAY